MKETIMAAAGKRSSGFTLIEILVVIAILAFLASISFWGMSAIRQSMRIRQTQALVQRVSSSIRSFQTTFSEWPTQTLLDSLAPPQNWPDFLRGGYLKVPAGGSDPMPKYENRGPFIEFSNRELDSDGDVVDIWGNKIVILVDDVNKRLLVYSFGPDLQSDNGMYRGDGHEEADYTSAEPIDDIVAK